MSYLLPDHSMIVRILESANITGPRGLITNDLKRIRTEFLERGDATKIIKYALTHFDSINEDFAVQALKQNFEIFIILYKYGVIRDKTQYNIPDILETNYFIFNDKYIIGYLIMDLSLNIMIYHSYLKLFFSQKW